MDFPAFRAASITRELARQAALAALAAALCSCRTPPDPPDYPFVAPGPGVASLLIDTYIKQSWTATFAFEVYVDGFKLRKSKPPDMSRLSMKERVAARERRARMRLRLEPGNHEVAIFGLISGALFDPVVIRADVEQGRGYAIRLVPGSGTAFEIRYEGWTDDESALWPRERRVELRPF